MNRKDNISTYTMEKQSQPQAFGASWNASGGQDMDNAALRRDGV